jgi:uncharacterized repeat protein (TIGR03803 family)
LHSFTGGSDGGEPYGGLVLGSDGYFYGTTSVGGSNGYGDGTVFKISTNGEMTTLHSFTGEPTDGATPLGGVVQGSDGYFYGTTEIGGTNELGTVFKMSTNGTVTLLYSFTGGDDGAEPYAGVVQGSDGYLYGTSFNHSTNDWGTVFKISTNGGALTTLWEFGSVTGFPPNNIPLDGGFIYDALIQGRDGYLYGTADVGGTNHDGGTVFQISTNGVLTVLYEFGANETASGYFLDGDGPIGSLVQGSDGSFYGTTSVGGTNNAGTVFRLSIVPEFLAVTLTNSTLSLTWSTEAGGTYQLQYNSDLISSNWISLGSAFTATGTTLSTNDRVTNGPQRFYRVVLLP